MASPQSPTVVLLKPPGPTRSHTGEAGALLEISTDGILPAERIDFWHLAHLDRMAIKAGCEEGRLFEGRMRRILGTQSHLVDHSSDALTAVRTRQHCQRDGVDYVSVNLMLDGGNGVVDHGGQRRIKAGSVYFVDSALPVEFHMPSYHAVSIFLPRGKVQEAVGGSPQPLAAGLQASSGMNAVLRNHMRMVAAQAPAMTPAERVISVSACADMALSVLQAAHQGAADVDQFAEGFYEAARRVILQFCGDPQLDPASVATRLGCSRASLYRLFFRHGESVSNLIWATRVQRAHEMVAAQKYASLSLAEIAFQSGFLDQASFNRMFKRRYGMTPGDARALRAPAFRRPGG